MGQAKGRTRDNAPTPRFFRAAWKHREPVMWVAIVFLGLTGQWPALSGWYRGATPAVQSASAVTWRNDFAAALSEARSSHKRVLVDFSASWCPPCVAMKHEVWPDPDVVRAIDSGYVPVMIDADRDNGLSARYRVEGIPAVLILDADGRIVMRHDGYLPKAGMVKLLADAAN